jgi:uncharacterized protein YodC (DUF2158 family)
MEIEDIKIGDAVKASTVMTVNEIKDNTVECIWFDENQTLHREKYTVATLKKINS